jgi:ABC-type Fe3+-siderophore transport system permease subunit
VIRIIFGHLVSGTISWDQTEDLIIWDFRLPRVLLAAVVGAALAVSGTTLQALVRNPLGRVPIAPEELPAGIITAALGGPFFLWLLRTRAKGSKESENVS